MVCDLEKSRFAYFGCISLNAYEAQEIVEIAEKVGIKILRQQFRDQYMQTQSESLGVSDGV